jgi:hypothetical protein
VVTRLNYRSSSSDYAEGLSGLAPRAGFIPLGSVVPTAPQRVRELRVFSSLGRRGCIPTSAVQAVHSPIRFPATHQSQSHVARRSKSSGVALGGLILA